MIVINLKDLMVEKGAEEGLSYNISKAHVEKICEHFNLTPNDLIILIPD